MLNAWCTVGNLSFTGGHLRLVWMDFVKLKCDLWSETLLHRSYFLWFHWRKLQGLKLHLDRSKFRGSSCLDGWDGIRCSSCLCNLIAVKMSNWNRRCGGSYKSIAKVRWESMIWGKYYLKWVRDGVKWSLIPSCVDLDKALWNLQWFKLFEADRWNFPWTFPNELLCVHQQSFSTNFVRSWG